MGLFDAFICGIVAVPGLGLIDDSHVGRLLEETLVWADEIMKNNRYPYVTIACIQLENDVLYRRLLAKHDDNKVYIIQSEMLDKIENVHLSDNNLKDLKEEGFIVVKVYNNQGE